MAGAHSHHKYFLNGLACIIIKIQLDVSGKMLTTPTSSPWFEIQEAKKTKFTRKLFEFLFPEWEWHEIMASDNVLVEASLTAVTAVTPKVRDLEAWLSSQVFRPNVLSPSILLMKVVSSLGGQKNRLGLSP